ncbi:DUF4307 domain-containing protein [Timonella senegalensis]|uniref:DUF4307 domain-containing protein n=1 Tax=Timonella senegalensis TaxID=1465825 RepID=UPI0028A62C75|nr:DUF4307 domain-containing protein [Timonella senegalensis]
MVTFRKVLVNYEHYDEYELDEDAPVLASSTPSGPSGSLTPRGRKFAIALGVVVILVAVAVMAYIAFAIPTIRGKDVGFNIKSPEVIEITFDVAKPEDWTVECTLNALNENYAQVGTKIVTIGPAETYEQRFSTDIRTTEIAVTAVVDSCLPTDMP